MKLDQTVFNKNDWEYILVLYRICSSDLKESSFSHQHFELSTGQSSRLIELITVSGMCITSMEVFQGFRPRCCFALY